MNEKATVSNNNKKQIQIRHKGSQYTRTAQLQLKLTKLYVASNTTTIHKWLCEKLLRHTSLQTKKMRLAVITILQKLTIASILKHNILPVHTTAGSSTRPTLAEQSKVNTLQKTCTRLLIKYNSKKLLN